MHINKIHTHAHTHTHTHTQLYNIYQVYKNTLKIHYFGHTACQVNAKLESEPS